MSRKRPGLFRSLFGFARPEADADAAPAEHDLPSADTPGAEFGIATAASNSEGGDSTASKRCTAGQQQIDEVLSEWLFSDEESDQEGKGTAPNRLPIEEEPVIPSAESALEKREDTIASAEEGLISSVELDSPELAEAASSPDLIAVDKEFPDPSPGMPRAERPETTDSCDTLRVFQEQGGSVDAPPDNLGHLSRAYEAVRPQLIGVLHDQLNVKDTEDLTLNRLQWQGGGLKESLEFGDSGQRALCETAIHRGGKGVNKDAAGCCEGVLSCDGGREPFAIVAVADGVTSSLYSEFGALVAVGAALKSTLRFFRQIYRTQGLPLPLPPTGQYARFLCGELKECQRLLQRLRIQVVEALLQCETVQTEPTCREACDVARQQAGLLKIDGEHLATTLVSVCATPRWFSMGAFGNGFTWVGFSTGDTAATWQPDPDVALDCFLSTNHIPEAPSYAWTGRFEDSGIVAVGAGTDGVPSVGELQELYRPDAACSLSELLDFLVDRQMQKCRSGGYSTDYVDNAAFAQIDMRNAYRRTEP